MDNHAVLQDFKRRYEHTFIHVEDPDTKDKNLFFLEQVVENDDHVGALYLTSNELGKIVINMGSEHTLKFLPVPVGVFQHDRFACVCRRVPRKQYARGICSENTALHPVTNSVFRHNLALDWDIVSNAFKGKTHTFAEAIKMLNTTDVIQVALANNYSISLNVTTLSDSLILFFWDVPVATLKPDGTLQQVQAKVFTNRIMEIIK